MIKKIGYYFNKNKKLFIYKILFKLISNRVVNKMIPSKLWLKLEYYISINKELNLKNPRTFNEKLQWLKLYDRNPEYVNLVDKYKVRNYIEKAIGREYLIPLIGVYDRYEDINFDELPDQFVLKPNHTSGDVFICKDKNKIDYNSLEEEVNSWLKREYYWYHREWCYKNIEPKILCEKFMVDESGVELKDYKFLCFNGEPKIIQVMSGRANGNYYLNHFDLDWNNVNIKRKTHKESFNLIKKPDNLNEMIQISEILSREIPFSRIDLYKTSNQILFGEITLFPVSGYMDFANEELDELLGSWIELPSKVKD